MMPEESIITTPRLRIVPFTEAHLSERYMAWLNDPIVVQFSEQRHREHTMVSCREYVESYAGSPHFLFAIIAPQLNPDHIGNINAYVDEANGVADMGIMVGDREAWGQGYGSEAWVAVVDFLLRTKGLRKITAGTISCNVGMLGIMNRCGMIDDGTRRAQFLVDGQPFDMKQAAIFKEIWLEQHPAVPFAS